MTKRVFISFIILSLLLTTFAFADGSSNDPPWPADRVVKPELKYTEWYFNNDFTEVTVKVDGKWKTYDNYIVITRMGDKLQFYNSGADYLTDPLEQPEYTPDEFFTREMKKIRSQGGTEAFFPMNETISVNYKPWQESEFKDHIMERYYNHRYRYGEDDVWEFIQDKNNNGYALEVFKRNKDIETAKKEASLSRMKIEAEKYWLYKTSEEFLADYKSLNTDRDPQLALHETYGRVELTQDEFHEILKEEPGKIEMKKEDEQETSEDENEQKQNGTALNIEETVISPDKNQKKKLELAIGSKELKAKDMEGEKIKTFSVEPFIENGTTFIPLRGILEEIGADIGWDQDTKQITIHNNNDKVTLTINSKTAVVNGKDMEISEAPKLVGGNTMIPLRFVAENMGCEVKWNEQNKSITILKQVPFKAPVSHLFKFGGIR